MRSACNDVTVLGSFGENHDVPRFGALTSDMSLARNFISFTMLADGVPILYEGQEQHYQALGGSSDPYNREAIWYSGYNTEAPLYILVTALNSIRSWAASIDSGYLTYNNYVVYSDSSTIAMRKGYAGKQIIAVLSNLGDNGASYTLTLGNTGFTSGEVVVEVLTCETVTADSNGDIAVPMASGLPRIYFPLAALDNSGICSSLTKRSVYAL